MSDEQPKETPNPTAEPTNSVPAEQQAPADDTGGKPANREQTVDGLINEAAKLASARFSRITQESADRLAGVGTINVFHGDVSIEGDFLSGSSGKRSSARRAGKTRLAQADLAEQTAYFVRPPGFEEGVDTLTDNNLVVFSGPARTGRRTRALATLVAVLDQTHADAGIFELGNSVLRNMSWRVPEPGCGLLVVDEPGKNGKYGAESITDEWLGRTSQQLAEHDSYLVIVSGPVRGHLDTARRRAEFVLEDMELPDPTEIVLARIQGEAPWAMDGIEQRLTAAGLPEVFLGRDDPGFATRIASAVCKALREEADIEAEIAEFSDPRKQVGEWLNREPEIAEIAFVLSTAVLEGGSYLNVADAAVDLYRQLSSSSAILTPRYMRGLNDERDWIEMYEPDEPAGTLFVRFKNNALRPAVVVSTWVELDGARTKILAWLKGLVEHTDVEVRARAAEAVGILANRDFEHAVHKYFLPWGSEKSWVLRQSVAHGLNVAATFGGHTQAAWWYIEQWAQNTRSSSAATAGLAVGGPLGVQSPNRALRVLRSLVDSDADGLLEPVAISIQTLLEADRGTEILNALLEWSEPGANDSTVLKALKMFAFAVTTNERGTDHPSLMRTADRYRDALPELWGRALANESVRDPALRALESWVRTVDFDTSMWDHVLVVIAGIADRGGTDFERLLHALHGWAVDKDHPSDAAVDFHNVLLEAEAEAS